MRKLAPLALLLLFFACKKEAEPLPAPFAGTAYETLGTFDDQGKPRYLIASDVISSNMLAYISSTLPDQKDLRTTNPELLTTKAIADLTITQRSEVYITFVSQATNSRNSFAFYTYPTDAPPASAKDIKTITYVFPNAGNNPPLKAGDKVKIGTFEKGTSVGFVLLRNAWNTTTKKPDNTAVHFCSNDVLNPEVDPTLRKHAVLINYDPEDKVLIGFEDVDRTKPNCDHDFGDLIVYASVRF